MNTTVSYIYQIACAPDQTPSTGNNSLVYGYVGLENGNAATNNQYGQPNAIGYLGINGADPWGDHNTQPEAYFDSGWYAFVATNSDETGENAPAGSFTASAEPAGIANATAYRTTPVSVGVAYGAATRIPDLIVASAPSLQWSCNPEGAGGPGTATCTASPSNGTADQTHATYHWAWDDGSTSDGATVTKTFATDGAFGGSLTATADNGLTTVQRVNGDSRLCYGGPCLQVDLKASPDGQSSDPADWPLVNQSDTLTATITNNASVSINGIVPAALDNSSNQYDPASLTSTPDHIDTLAPGQTATVTWTPTFLQAGEQQIKLHLDGTTAAGRAVTGDQSFDYHVASPLVVNSTQDTGESSDAASGVCDDGATTKDASGKTIAECTLRAAIQTVNALGGASSGSQPVPITFNVPGGSTALIEPTTPLPPITSSTGIDGTSQAGGTLDAPSVWLDGSKETSGDGLDVQTANVGLSGLRVTDFPGTGIAFSNADGGTLTASVIGVTQDGTSSAQPTEVSVRSSHGVSIGGATTTQGNVIAGAADVPVSDVTGPAAPDVQKFLTDGVGVWVGDGSSSTMVLGDTIGTATAPDLIGVLVAGESSAAGDTTLTGDKVDSTLGVVDVGAFPSGSGSASGGSGAVDIEGTSFVNEHGLGVLATGSYPRLTVSGQDTFTGAAGVLVLTTDPGTTAITENSFSSLIGVMLISSSGDTISNDTFTDAAGGIVAIGGAAAGGLPSSFSGDSVTGTRDADSLGLLLDHEGPDTITGSSFSADVGALVGDSPGLTFAGDDFSPTKSSNDTDEQDESLLGLLLANSTATVTGSSFQGEDLGALGGVTGKPANLLVPAVPDTGTGLATSGAVAGELASGGVATIIAKDWQGSVPLDGSDVYSTSAATGSPTAAASVWQGNTFSGDGVALFAGGAGTLVGGGSSALGNTFVGNRFATVIPLGSGVTVSHNSMNANDAELTSDGRYLPVILTDEATVPSVAAAYPTGNATVLSGTLQHAVPDTTYTLELYADTGDACPPSAHSGLGSLIDQLPVTTDGTGAGEWTDTVTATPLSVGQQIGAIATLASEGTSQPSLCTAVSPAGTTTTTDTSPGQTEVPVTSNATFTVGSTVIIDPGAADQETAVIDGFGSLILDHGLSYAHPAGTVIVEKPAVVPPTATTSPSSPTTPASPVWAAPQSAPASPPAPTSVAPVGSPPVGSTPVATRGRYRLTTARVAFHGIVRARKSITLAGHAGVPATAKRILVRITTMTSARAGHPVAVKVAVSIVGGTLQLRAQSGTVTVTVLGWIDPDPGVVGLILHRLAGLMLKAEPLGAAVPSSATYVVITVVSPYGRSSVGGVGVSHATAASLVVPVHDGRVALSLARGARATVSGYLAAQ